MTATLTLALWSALSPAPAFALSPPSDLPPDARAHNNAGVALLAEGKYDDALAELQRAYDAMPDPLLYRAGRGKVLGSLRSVLRERHDATGDPRPLCRLQALLRGHIDALLTALGPTAEPQDLQGTRLSLHETNLALARAKHTCAAPVAPVVQDPAPPPTVAAAPPADAPAPASTLTPPPARPRASRLRIAGGVTTAVGFAALSAMAYGIAIVAHTRNQLRDLTDNIHAAGRDPTDQEASHADALYDQGVVHRALAISTGVLGGAALVTGITLLAVDRRHRATRLAPVLHPTFVGAHLRLRF